MDPPEDAWQCGSEILGFQRSLAFFFLTVAERTDWSYVILFSLPPAPSRDARLDFPRDFTWLNLQADCNSSKNHTTSQSPSPLFLPLGQSEFHSGFRQPAVAPGPGHPSFTGVSSKGDFTLYLPVSSLENRVLIRLGFPLAVRLSVNSKCHFEVC